MKQSGTQRHLQVLFSFRSWLSSALWGAALLCGTALLLTPGCVPPGASNADLANSAHLNISLSGLSGNQQSAQPNELFQNTLTVQATDLITGLPLSNVGIEFKELSSTGALIVSPTVNTDGSGIAKTQVRAPSSYNETIQISAQASDSPSTAIFNLNTGSESKVYSFSISTTHHLIESAGTPYHYVISLVDQNGGLYSSYNQNLTLLFTTQTAHAWAWNGSSSTDYQAAPLSFNCEFVGGICTTTDSFTLTDASHSTLVSVKESTDTFSQTTQSILVLPGTASQLVVANLPGGPKGTDGQASTSDDARALTNSAVNSSQQILKFSAALVDPWGNYLRDATGAVWTLSQEAPTLAFTPYFNLLTGTNISFTPGHIGSALLTVSLPSAPQINPGTVGLYVTAGTNAPFQSTIIPVGLTGF